MKKEHLKERAAAILELLEREFPRADCALVHDDPFQLLVATILSAQCTDAKVNQVTPELFRKYPTPRVLARASQEEVEALIRPTGFFTQKARYLREASALLVERFQGRVPDRMEDLVSLPGVARKTANVVLGTWFGKNEGIVVDTHVKRLAGRLGLSGEKDPGRIERDLQALFPRESWTFLGHALILLGRKFCKARKPSCPECPLREACPQLGVEKRDGETLKSLKHPPRKRRNS